MQTFNAPPKRVQSTRPATRSISPTLRTWGRENATAIFFVLILTLGLLAEMPWMSRPARVHLLQAIVISLAALMAFRDRSARLGRKELLQGPSPWIAGVLVWAVFLTIFPPSRSFGVSGMLEPYAIGELLRLLYCFGVFYTAAYWLKSSEIGTVLFGTMALGAVVTTYGFIAYNMPQPSGSEMTSIFGNHEQAGSFVMMLLLPPLALAISRRVGVRWQVAGQVLAIMLVAELMIALCRSAWIGSLAGIAVLLILKLKMNPIRLNGTKKTFLIGPLLVVGLAVAGLAFSDQIGPLISNRATTFRAWTEDASLSNRIHRWKAACFMTRIRPVTGWGLGSFPVLQQRFTGEGDTPDFVLRYGTGHSNLAHNFWVQWASETGCVGLGLYAGAFVAGFLSLIVMARRAVGPIQPLLLGCIAAIAAAAADMVSSPSYTFPGVAALPFLWMGLGVTIARATTSAARDDEAAMTITPVWVHVTAAVIAAASIAIVLSVGRRL